ncbi:MAG TPA: acyl carrier protein [Streptosporangiaceae bacterium]
MTTALAAAVRQLLAELTGDDRPLTAPDSTPLLRDGLGLDSLGGTMLLAAISQRYGIDIAAEDLNLDSLASIGALTDFLSARLDLGW